MKACIKCGSHAFNLYAEEIDQGGLCDVHYWQGRAHRAEALAQPDAFEQGRQEGMKQERALWELSKLGQEIEAQPVQEPVAIVDANDDGYWADILPDRSVKVGQLLYTTPPQRPWVGLTEVDILAESKHWKNPEDFMDGVYWAETTLKEKNT